MNMLTQTRTSPKEPVIQEEPKANEEQQSVEEPQSHQGSYTPDEGDIQSLVAMGFLREDVITALSASLGNQDIAVQYLLNADEDEMLLGDEELMEGEDDMGEEGDGSNPFEVLRTIPFFNQLRRDVQQNPAQLEVYMKQLAEKHPQLFSLIQQNQDDFIKLLQEPVEPSEDMPNVIPVSTTPEEKEAIERLMSLGFSEGQVLEAFLICDRNEELAANYLLNSLDEDFGNLE